MTSKQKESYIRKLMRKRHPQKRGPKPKKNIEEQEEHKFAPTAPNDCDIAEEIELMTNKYKG